MTDVGSVETIWHIGSRGEARRGERREARSDVALVLFDARRSLVRMLESMHVPGMCSDPCSLSLLLSLLLLLLLTRAAVAHAGAP